MPMQEPFDAGILAQFHLRQQREPRGKGYGLPTQTPSKNTCTTTIGSMGQREVYTSSISRGISAACHTTKSKRGHGPKYKDDRLYALFCSFVDDFQKMKTADKTAERKHGGRAGERDKPDYCAGLCKPDRPLRQGRARHTRVREIHGRRVRNQQLTRGAAGHRPMLAQDGGGDGDCTQREEMQDNPVPAPQLPNSSRCG